MIPYTIDFRKRAIKEYVEATAWYQERSLDAAEGFVLIVEQTILEIKSRPNNFRIIYRNYREAKTKKYPYNIVYFIDDKKQTIVITTLFHQKRNPKKKFR